MYGRKKRQPRLKQEQGQDATSKKAKTDRSPTEQAE